MLNNIILFIQPIEEAVKMGKMYLNRLAIDEDGAYEILCVEKLEMKATRWTYDYMCELLYSRLNISC